MLANLLYGKKIEKNRNITYKCNHGVEEFEASKVLACANYLYNNNNTLKLFFFYIDCCMHDLDNFWEGPYNTSAYCL